MPDREIIIFNLFQDYRTSAEKARSELDQKQVKGRPLKVRFAPANVRLKVKNLGPMVSNELLELAFSIFGDVSTMFLLLFSLNYKFSSKNDEILELPFELMKNFHGCLILIISFSNLEDNLILI